MITMELCEEDKKAQQSLVFLKKIFAHHPSRDFAVRLWDGSCLAPEAGQTRRFTLVINHPGVLKKLLWHPTQLGLGEAYVFKDLDIEGDLEAALKLPGVMTGIHVKWRKKVSFAKWLLSLPTTDKARKAHSRILLMGVRPDGIVSVRPSVFTMISRAFLEKGAGRFHAIFLRLFSVVGGGFECRSNP